MDPIAALMLSQTIEMERRSAAKHRHLVEREPAGHQRHEDGGWAGIRRLPRLQPTRG